MAAPLWAARVGVAVAAVVLVHDQEQQGHLAACSEGCVSRNVVDRKEAWFQRYKYWRPCDCPDGAQRGAWGPRGAAGGAAGECTTNHDHVHEIAGCCTFPESARRLARGGGGGRRCTEGRASARGLTDTRRNPPQVIEADPSLPGRDPAEARPRPGPSITRPSAALRKNLRGRAPRRLPPSAPHARAGLEKIRRGFITVITGLSRRWEQPPDASVAQAWQAGGAGSSVNIRHAAAKAWPRPRRHRSRAQATLPKSDCGLDGAGG